MAAAHTPVNDIIKRLVSLSKLPDTYFSNTPRWAIQEWARYGVLEFTKKYTSRMRAIRMTVEENNWVQLPDDYVKLLGVSEFGDCGKLTPIGFDPSIMSTNVFLLDSDGKKLLDHKGSPLLGSGDDDIDRDCYSYDYSNGCYYNDYHLYTGYYTSYSSLAKYYNINDSFAREVKYTLDENNNKIQFSGRDVGEVVVDYVYDVEKAITSMSDLEIHHMFADALYEYVYYNILSQKRASSVPMAEKEMSRRKYEKALTKAKLHAFAPTVSLLKHVTNLK